MRHNRNKRSSKKGEKDDNVLLYQSSGTLGASAMPYFRVFESKIDLSPPRSGVLDQRRFVRETHP
jgi:hypothetical protein